MIEKPLQMPSLVKTKNIKMYLKYIYLILSILHTFTYYLHITKLVYLKSDKLEQLILCLMHFNCVEVVLKSN